MQGCHNRYALVQYWFDGPQVDIKIKPHGNSKSSHPYFRTASSAKAQHKMVAASHTPKSAVQIAARQQGGELDARGLNKLPRNVDQMKNYRRTETKKESDVLYSVMLQCKLSEGKSDAFVRDVKAAPEPQCVLFTDWQLNDLARFITKPSQFCVFTADTTYNLGDFYVTPTTYQHLMLEDTVSQKHPFFLGPILIHQRKNFSSFNYLVSTLVGFNKKLQDVQVFGTDGDPALIEAFSHNFHSAKQLRCFIHLKKNIAEKLRDRGIPSSETQEFLADIFGRRSGITFEEGLVDSSDGDDFDVRLASCELVWSAREGPYARQGQVSFFDYFKMQYSSVIRNTMLKDLRTFAGLGSPPGSFTTNGCESLNAVIKRKVNYKATEWPEFNNQLKEIVDGQRDEAIRSLSGRGQFRLCEQYRHLQIHPQEWVKMTSDQRRTVVKKFDDSPLRKSKVTGQAIFQTTVSIDSNPESGGVSTKSCISITSEDCGITTLPQPTLDSIWTKALEYVLSSSDVVAAPGGDPKAKMVSSRSGTSPHYVRALASGQYVCDNSCLQWKSSQICSHTVAVSERNGDLQSFLDWYIVTKQTPNYTSLAIHGLPAGRGRKGGVPKRQRSKVQPRAEISVLRPATRSSESDQVGVCKDSTATLPPSSMESASNNTSLSEPQSAGTCSSYLSRSSRPPSKPSTVHYGSVQSASSLTSVDSSSPVVTQNQTITIHQNFPGPANPTQALSPNPFFLRFIQGNIRVCQGCRTTLRTMDGGVPKAPFDLVVARFERRTFRDKSGELHTPLREQAVHYHLKPCCIRVVAPDFVSSNVSIPADVQPLLTPVHKEYLRLMFSLQLL